MLTSRYGKTLGVIIKMALNTPENSQEIESRSKADVLSSAPASNPFLRNSWLAALISADSNRIFDFYKNLDAAVLETFFDTSSGDFLQRQASWFGIERLTATAGSGNLVVTGTSSTVVPAGTEFKTSDGIAFTTDSSATISDNVVSVSTLTLNGTTVTANTASNHNLATGISVTIIGAVETDYNGAFTVIVIDEDTFTYEISTSPSSPATGTITAEYVSGLAPATSNDETENANLDPGTQLTISTAIAGVDDVATVDALGTRGGSDLETDEGLRDRFLFRVRNPVAHFNEADIISQARTVAGVTRVFVEPAGTDIGTVSVTSITRNANVATVTTAVPHGFDDGQTTTIEGAIETEYDVTDARIIVESSTVFHYVVLGTPTTPATGTITASTKIPEGQVRIFFMRDNDTNAIPDGAEVAEVNDAILDIVPANTVDDDVIVNAPIANQIDFTFTSIFPDTTSMRNSVTSQLNSLFSEFTTVSQGLTEDAYRTAIFNTIDTENGERLESFVLSTPSGDIAGSSGQIPTLGQVNF